VTISSMRLYDFVSTPIVAGIRNVTLDPQITFFDELFIFYNYWLEFISIYNLISYVVQLVGKLQMVQISFLSLFQLLYTGLTLNQFIICIMFKQILNILSKNRIPINFTRTLIVIWCINQFARTSNFVSGSIDYIIEYFILK
jgi:hypothetical protein